MRFFDLAAWQADGACRTHDTDLFFPERGQPLDASRRICAGCPVREQCLDYAVEHNIGFGVWGGLSERERRRIRSWKPRRCVECGVRDAQVDTTGRPRKRCVECDEERQRRADAAKAATARVSHNRARICPWCHEAAYSSLGHCGKWTCRRSAQRERERRAS